MRTIFSYGEQSLTEGLPPAFLNVPTLAFDRHGTANAICESFFAALEIAAVGYVPKRAVNMIEGA